MTNYHYNQQYKIKILNEKQKKMNMYFLKPNEKKCQKNKLLTFVI